jgi:hypothetical protein
VVVAKAESYVSVKKLPIETCRKVLRSESQNEFNGIEKNYPIGSDAPAFAEAFREALNKKLYKN